MTSPALPTRSMRALALFRGEPYAELGDLTVASAERRQLDELRRHVAEHLVEIELTRGRYAEIVGRLELVVGADPTDERAWSQLIRALQGDGRQADALAAATRARRALATELGIEPGALLRAAEQDVLEQRGERSAPAGNLPLAVDSFVGRSGELAAIGVALARHRLVTLVGPGGAGKTRLAIEAARSVDQHAWLVELAAVTEPGRVADALATALGAERGLDRLAAAVAGRDMVVVVDNCEHVLDAAADAVGSVLRTCPTVHVVATSRERLHLRGEHVVEVRPLDPASAARELFLDRGEAASSTFDRATAAAGDVATVCQRLDGLPLALEIAAAQLRWLSLPELVERLDRRFGAMSSGTRDVDVRQRTLDSVIAWSTNRLDDADQAGLRRLAMFPDSFSLAAAEAMLGDGGRLIRLVDASLVAVSPVGQQPRRYSMLATIREHLADRRDALDETFDARRRLAAWAEDFVGDVEAAIRTPRQDEAMHRAIAERLNLAAALDAAEALGEWTLALRIAAAVPLAGPDERERLITRLFERATDAPPAVRARAAATLANLAVDRDDAAATIAAATAYREAATDDGDAVQRAWALYFLALGHWANGDQRDVTALLHQGLAEFDALALADGAAYLRWIAALTTDDLVAAAGHADAATRAFRDLGMPFGLAHALEASALVDLRAGQLEHVGTWLAEAVTILGAADEAGCTAHCLEAVAAHAVELGRVAEAAELLGIAEALRRATGHGHRVWEVQGHRRAVAALDAAGVAIPEHDGPATVGGAVRCARAALTTAT
ncbi:MAG: BTAD domain-containing putative transcriptional regulator [Ilumatobacteraceae bacterium]